MAEEKTFRLGYTDIELIKRALENLNALNKKWLEDLEQQGGFPAYQDIIKRMIPKIDRLEEKFS